MTTDTPGARLREHIAASAITAFIGVHDVFSARVAARRGGALFISGFGVTASHLGLPDHGYVSAPDLLDLVRRVRAVLPDPHLLVDIDDGFADPAVAAHTVRALERVGASGIVLEDQARPRRCGHLEGKRILPLGEYLEKLRTVLAARRSLFVVARTDASDPDDVLERVAAFRDAGCDAVLADGVRSLDLLDAIRDRVDCPVVFNQVAGGRSPVTGLADLHARGVRMVLYSTALLFAAQGAMESMLAELDAEDGSLERAIQRGETLGACALPLADPPPTDAP
jgi:2-methylisocitrate lyase-like PEP mutase family enzyme